MPAWGLIPDSPWFYYGGKALRAGRGGGRFGSARRGFVQTKFLISFQKLVIYKPILNYELNVPTGMVGQHMLKLGLKIQAGARKKVGVKTGALRDSIHVEQNTTGGRQYVKVGSRLPYAYMHHEGTRPHIIAAHPPGKLMFRSRSRGVVITTSVMHPGTKPNRYLSSQLRKFIR